MIFNELNYLGTRWKINTIIQRKNLKNHTAKIIEINKYTFTVVWNKTRNISKIDIVFILNHYEISNRR